MEETDDVVEEMDSRDVDLIEAMVGSAGKEDGEKTVSALGRREAKSIEKSFRL